MHLLSYVTVRFGLLCYKGSRSWKDKISQLLGPISVTLPSFCCFALFSLCLHPDSLRLVLCYKVYLKITKDIYIISICVCYILYHSICRAAFASLLDHHRANLTWVGPAWFVYIFVLVWTLYAASSLEDAVLNTNLCSVAVLAAVSAQVFTAAGWFPESAIWLKAWCQKVLHLHFPLGEVSKV